MADLEEFIKQYLKNQKAEDYESWLSNYGTDGETAYREAVAEAEGTLAEQRAGYGKQASTLLARGLSGSGYSNYLDQAAYAQKAMAIQKAREQRQKTERENRKGYAAFLADAAKLGEEKQEKVGELIGELFSEKILDPALAAEYLTLRGVDTETAKALGNTCTGLIKNTDTRSQRVLKHVLDNYFGYSAAYEYAVANGLSEEVAQQIAKAAGASQKAYFNAMDN